METNDIIALETAALAIFTLALAWYTAGLYFQTKRANRPHVSAELGHANDVGSFVISIENHGPGVALDIKVALESDFSSDGQVVLSTTDPRLQIEFLKPSGVRTIRLPSAGNLSPAVVAAKLCYRDVFKQKHSGEFKLAVAALGEPDHRYREDDFRNHVIISALGEIAGPLFAIPKSIEDLGGEVRTASSIFRSRIG